eukprot:8039352-Karenia_brevis.AAC.1
MHESGKFKCILLNARSVQTETHFQEHLTESEDCQWDLLLINETWRGAKQEHVKVCGGHKWLGSGGSPGQPG